MSRGVVGVLGAIGVLATLGAAQLAFGHDLTVGLATAGTPGEEVNRAGKTDRLAIAPPAAPTRTVAIHVDRLPDTSILVRIPLGQEARSSAPPATIFTKEERKANVACEPVVSVLTEIAKRLQPGRCVT
jgi:hypothetical protein